MNKKPKIAIAIIANRFEAGGERYEALRTAAADWMQKEHFDYLSQSVMVWDSADALRVCAEIEAQDADVLMLIHASWVQDSIQHIFTNRLKLPTILFAVPYVETFSLACAQHYAAQLKRYALPYKVIFGMPGSDDVSAEVRSFILAAAAYKNLRNSVAGVIGPRQTFRVSAAQDMTMEEWDFSDAFGTTVVHIETSELLSTADSVSKEAAAEMMLKLRGRKDIEIMLDDNRLEFCVRVYLAIKQLRDTYGLTFCAAQCYPNNGGICNLASSLLADEGYILDTEGDLGHAALMYAYSTFGGSVACLSETGGLTPQYMYLEHEGSTALTLKTEGFKATLRECGDGSMLGFTLRPMKEATIASLGWADGDFTIFTVEGSVVPVDTGVWQALEGRFLGAFNAASMSPKEMHAHMVCLGVDHHFALKEGNHAGCLEELCGMLGIKYKTI
jgi:L-fucose isomerase-like protein